MTFKCLVFDEINGLVSLNSVQGVCVSCGENMSDSIVALVNTLFNVSSKNFTVALNRKEVAHKSTMKMVKELKRKTGVKIQTKLKMTTKTFQLGR